MRSRASVRGIPIHPALVHYPFAFLTGGFLFDLAGVLAGRPPAWVAGAWLVLAGIAAALVAAVPGFLDYLHTVPPNSSGKRRATRHLAANLSAVTLFGAGWLLRGEATALPGTATLLLEGTGTLLLFHGRGTLAGGALSCGAVQCPWHGSRFDVETGSVRAGPATAPIRSYTVEARGSGLLIHLSQ